MSSADDPVSKRRTFAIIAHPDAGKTTLTEKLLLFGGAIQLAGEVKAKKDRIQTRSDWMNIERDRGISVCDIRHDIRIQGLHFQSCSIRRVTKTLPTIPIVPSRR